MPGVVPVFSACLLHLSSNTDHVRSTTLTPEATLRLRQDVFGYMMGCMMTSPTTDRREEPLLLMQSALWPSRLKNVMIVTSFQSCRRASDEQM